MTPSFHIPELQATRLVVLMDSSSSELIWQRIDTVYSLENNLYNLGFDSSNAEHEGGPPRQGYEDQRTFKIKRGGGVETVDGEKTD